MTYRWVTNLRVPFDGLDLALLAELADYRIGAVVPADPAKVATARPGDALTTDGFVGLYTTPDAMKQPLVKRRTGWSSRTLSTVPWQPLGEKTPHG